jgi:hypothetical protein
MKLPVTPNRLPLAQRLLSTTLRGFTGGWNVSDDDMNMSYRFATKLTNCYNTADGRIEVRCGVTKFGFTHGSGLINAEYFIDSIISVTANGDVWRTLADGSTAQLATGLWGETDFVSFAQFNGHLILCNGIDKPLDIGPDFAIEYLQDAATHTNINVPICKYVVAINRYLVMAGDPLEPDRVHISAKDAAGTWYGDPPPNNATRIDVGSVLPSAITIRGLLPFRGKLVVMFAEGLVFGTIGTEDEEGNHTPSFDDGVAGYGSISHRAGIAYGDDALFMDLEGVPSIRRTVLSTSFKPDRVSALIDPEIRDALSTLSFGALEDRVFAVHNKREGQFWLFIPNGSTLIDTTETRVFVYSRLADNIESWNDFTGWNFTCGLRTLQGELIFGDSEGNFWLYSGETDYSDLKQVPAVTGTGIPFTWEMPWLDFGNRAITKQTKYIHFDTRGESEFTVQMFVDNFADPSLSMEFSAGEQGGFGSGSQPFGGGRNTSHKKQYAWPCKFMIAKLRINGTASEGLSFVSITMNYLNGGSNR